MTSTNAKYKFIFDLVERQHDLFANASKADIQKRQRSIEEMYDLCDNDEQRSLVKDMITDFSEMNDEVYNLCLLDMVDAIISKGYPLDECLVVAMAHDHSADSSQAVLQDIKTYLCANDFPSGNYCNRIDHCLKARFKNIHHYFIVDDFVGSGSTVFNRNDELVKKLAGKQYTVHFVVAAGMRYAIDMLRAKGIDIHCSYLMMKGISEKYDKAIVPHKLQLMTDLEAKLAATIKQTELSEHHLGYKQSEALFCRKYRNIPNNVFPLFWWKRYSDNSVRDIMFNRTQTGY